MHAAASPKYIIFYLFDGISSISSIWKTTFTKHTFSSDYCPRCYKHAFGYANILAKPNMIAYVDTFSKIYISNLPDSTTKSNLYLLLYRWTLFAFLSLLFHSLNWTFLWQHYSKISLLWLHHYHLWFWCAHFSFLFFKRKQT